MAAMDAESLDRELGEGRVSAEVLHRLLEAEGYGAATTMSWLAKRLRILYQVATSGREIEVHARNGVRRMATLGEFDAWCASWFPEAHACFFTEKPTDPRPWF